MSSINKKFNVSDSLYQSVMEVMKKDKKEGSAPRNDREEQLAKAYGDPKRITHGDVLKMRGVTKEEIEQVDEKLGGTQNVLNQTTHKNNDPMRRLKVTSDHPRFKDKPLNKTSQDILKKRLKSAQGTHSKPNLPEETEQVDEVVHVYRQDADRDRGPLASKHSAPYREVNQKARDKLAGEVKSARKSGAFKVTHHASATGHSGKTYTQKTAGGSEGSKLHVIGLKNMPKANEETDYVDEGVMDTAKSVAKKVASKAMKALTGGSDKDQLQALRKRMGMKEGKDTPGNSYEHQCAIHVKSESFGEGRTVTTQHADPDADGNIAWYDVMFEHGIEKMVPTDTLEILVSESHMHSKKKKGM